MGAENNPQAGRIDSLSLTGSVIRARQAEIARLEVLDIGKPFSEADWDVAEAAGCFDLYAGLAERRCPGAPSWSLPRINRMAHVLGSAVQSAQHCSKPACRVAFLKPFGVSAREVAPLSEPHIRRTIAEFPLESAAELRAVTEAALLRQI